MLKAIILRLWREQQRVYGSHKVGKQMGREGLHAIWCTTAIAGVS